jgi:hypothetical protein
MRRSLPGLQNAATRTTWPPWKPARPDRTGVSVCRIALLTDMLEYLLKGGFYHVHRQTKGSAQRTAVESATGTLTAERASSLSLLLAPLPAPMRSSLAL